jgi:hypothetical protein
MRSSAHKHELVDNLGYGQHPLLLEASTKDLKRNWSAMEDLGVICGSLVQRASLTHKRSTHSGTG